MIPRSVGHWQMQDWRHDLREAITRPAELLQALELDPALLEPAIAAGRTFPLRVTKSYLARIRKGDPHDPLLRQILPLGEETSDSGGMLDPVGDMDATKTPGVLCKYPGRALMITTAACPIHCRYCFRRHYPYSESQAGRDDWAGALDWLQRHPDIDEVILSGGDPLMLDDERLHDLVGRLDRVASLRRLRIHSRVPIALPSRITNELTGMLTASRLRTVVVIHANHPREFDQAVATGLARLAGSGTHLLNQSVLLRGVNDCATTLAALSHILFDHGVLPYYLHLLDDVRGAGHFRVGEDVALALHRSLQADLPGYLVPRLVREDAGNPSKTIVFTA